jgi:hypothetical protein
MKHDEATPQPAPLGQVERGVGPHAEVAERHLQAMRDCTRMVQAFGTSIAHAAAALRAFGTAAKALEEETKAMLEARRARQPWWRRPWRCD